MDAYVYQAALLCEDCALSARRDLQADAIELRAEEDSDHYPCGLYSNGGGEADCPQHCDHCGVFLENPLTTDGYKYVREAVAGHALRHVGTEEILAQWREFYDIETEDDEQDDGLAMPSWVHE